MLGTPDSRVTRAGPNESVSRKSIWTIGLASIPDRTHHFAVGDRRPLVTFGPLSGRWERGPDIFAGSDLVVANPDRRACGLDRSLAPARPGSTARGDWGTPVGVRSSPSRGLGFRQGRVRRSGRPIGVSVRVRGKLR